MKKKLVSGLLEKPLPEPLSSVDGDEYKLVEIDRDGLLFDEELVDVASQGIAVQAFYARRDGLNAPLYKPFESASDRVFLRKSVVERLKEVNRVLLPFGVEVLVWDGYRPVSVQKELWNWILEEARQRMPEASSVEQTEFALRFASDPEGFDPNNPETYPTHSTGGAVDLTLRELASGNSLYMGGIYLDPSENTATRFFENAKRNAPASDLEARRNRRLLYWAMSSFDFVNYAYEWWHFDYRTQAWVMNQGMPAGLKASFGVAYEGQVV
ncbi:MAG: D-alanyl-D-alanine carboxypeptidase family protein [Cyanobacteria bacterium HKST-UBA01]|nr:D-alanyl-D-alanine carboxypeptidase family protein [Cyanobacteria bacterium HKST-UBA01]